MSNEWEREGSGETLDRGPAQGFRPEDLNDVKVGSTSAKPVFFAAWLAVAVVAALIISFVPGVSSSVRIALIAVVVVLIIGVPIVLVGTGWAANHMTSGLLQLPFPGRQTVKANRRSADRLPQTSAHVSELRPEDLRKVQAMPLADNWDVFVSELASRMAAVVPDGFAVTSDQAVVTATYGDRSARSDLGPILRDARTPETDRAVSAALRGLTELQDFVTAERNDSWPGQKAIPRPAGEARNGT
ncbi:MAG TPA: hypothetical protein VGS21_00070, partial [Acidimicrobiales bacterium]|nr:hypothetical protein [Acidimicrobiales bacterium]